MYLFISCYFMNMWITFHLSKGYKSHAPPIIQKLSIKLYENLDIFVPFTYIYKSVVSLDQCFKGKM